MVNIQNENLANYLMFKLDKLQNEFAEEELASISELVVNPVDIAGDSTPINLDVLKYFTGLKTLEFVDLYIENKHIEHIKNMPQLKDLYFKRCQFENVQNIKDIKLEHLSFFNCNINCNFVYQKTELQSLALVGENVDLQKLNNLTKLNYLQLSYSKTNGKIELPNLTELHIDNTAILDLEFALNLTNLKKLSLSKTQIESGQEIIKKLNNNGTIVMNENMVKVEVQNA